MTAMRSALALAALLLVAAAPPGTGEREAAKETPAWAKKWLGRWSLYEDGEGGQGCTLNFVQGMSVGGAALQLSPTCRQNFPLEDVVGWRLSDPNGPLRGKKRPHIVFIDALRKPVLDFEPIEIGPWASALANRDGLERPQALLERDTDKPEHPTVRQMLKDGGFNLSGPNKKDWCGFGTTATSATGGKLSQDGHCARRWKGRGWASWTWVDGKLLLKDRKGAVLVTLTRGDDLTFENGSSADPLFFGPGAIQMS